MRSRVVIREDGPVIVVSGRRVGQLLAGAGFRARFSAPSRGYLLDGRHLADVVALLEYRSVPHRIERGEP